MSLIKLGSHLRILKTAAVAEDLLIERPVEASKPIISKVIEAKNSDFLYYRARAISAGDQGPLSKDGSRGWNFNGNKDYFPREQLESSYETFVGRNIFLDHNSESSLYSIGKIIDALPIDDPETGEFYIELVGKIDRTLHPEICRKIETGELNSTSMGCSVDESICSICGHVLHSDADEKCDHMGMNLGKEFPAEVDMPEYNIKKGDMVPCFSINKGIVFNEDSIVGVPADPSAVIKTVLSNMKNQISKKASLTKKEQLDLATQMDKLFDKLDDNTKLQLKADFCGICPPVEKESSMTDQNATPNEETKKILSKISALEMASLESYVLHKTKKANEVAHKDIVADSVAKEESFLSKIVAKVKDALSKEAGHKCKGCHKDIESDVTGEYCKSCEKEDKKASVIAKFTEDKNNVLDSTWSVNEGDKTVLEASLKEIWGSKFELLSFADQRWATSSEYAKEIIARYKKDGITKLADAWDVSHKISKVAKDSKCFNCDHSKSEHYDFVDGHKTECARDTCKCKEYESYPKDIKESSLKTASDPKLGPSGTYAKPTTGTDNKEHNVKNSPVTKPGQESGQKGPAAPAHQDMKTNPKFKMPGQEKGQTGPAAKTPMSVKTDYSEPKPDAEGKKVTTTPKNPDQKDAEKSQKEVETGYVAAGTEAMEAEDKGEKSDKKSSLISWASLTPAAQASIKVVAKTYIVGGMKNAEAVTKAYNEFIIAQETDMKKQASDGKPDESVDGSTLPEGTKSMGDKVEESVQGTTVPGGAKPSSAPETSAQGDKEHKTPNLTKKPDEAVDGTTLPPQGKKDEESVEKSTHPDSKKTVGTEPEKSVQASKSESAAPVEAVQDKPKLSKETAGDTPESAREGGDLKSDPKDIESVNKKAAAIPCGDCGKPYDVNKGEWCEDCMVKHLNKAAPVKNQTPSALPASRASQKAAAGTPCGGCGKPYDVNKGEFCEKCMIEHLNKKAPVTNKAPSPLPASRASKVAATEIPMPEDKDPMEAMKPEAPLDEKPMDLPLDGPAVDAPTEVSAFDTAETIDIGEGYSATKDKATNEIIVSKDGAEVKRLPDGFGKDMAAVLPLMKAVLGLPPEEVAPEVPGAIAPIEDEHKEEPKMDEVHPGNEEAHEDEIGIKESALKIKEAALAEKEAAIFAKEAAIKATELSNKFASVLQARTERCKKVIATMVEKDALQMDKEVYESELKIGTYLIDAQKKAFEHAIKAKQKELLAMDDNALLAMEKVIADLKTPSIVNQKKASRIYVSPSFGEELSEDAQLKKIFDTFGTKNRPQ